jgi:TolA-binding protein
MRRWLLCLTAVLGLAGPLFPQNAVFAPFVTRLSGTVRNKLVSLTWADSRSVRGPVYIYRSKSPFYVGGDTSGTKSAQAAEVPYGLQAFAEEVDSNGTWFYFVVASDDTRQQYELAIPYSNMIDVVVDGSNRTVQAAGAAERARSTAINRNLRVAPQPAQTAVESTTWTNVAPSYGITASGNSPAAGVPAPEASPEILNILAVGQTNGIYITFQSNNRSKNAVLYRSMQPVRQLGDLMRGAEVARVGVSSPCIDTPAQGVPYYYAIVFEEDIRSGAARIFPGSNATTQAVEVPAQAATRQASGYDPYALTGNPTPPQTSYGSSGAQTDPFRYTPLPPQNSGNSQQNAGSLSPEAVRAVEEFNRARQSAGPAAEPAEPKVFNQDLQSTVSSGDDYQLALIVQGPFMWRDWASARSALVNFLASGKNNAPETRAHFYLGQVYYFSGDYAEALNEFLAVRSRYPDEVSVWVQAALNKMPR